jgi:folate-binding protein YgfZ
MPSVCEMSYFLLFKCEYEIILNELLRVEPSLSDVPAELYEILRVESGFPLFGNELNEQHNPLEANLLHLVNFKKGCYIGQEVIARLDSYNKVKQRLMGFKSPLSIPVGCELVAEGNVIGEITSSAVSPMFGNIALGYIRTDFANNGRYVIARNDKLEFELLISSLPFHND